ncbi:hypothetical protein MMC16_001458 [Acarospora aff. strigata]|nr:hypothetical protein [Acarospora aff. strigata]
MGSKQQKRNYMPSGGAREADTLSVTGLDGQEYTLYLPTRFSDTEQLYDEFDYMATLQLSRAEFLLGYQPTSEEIIERRNERGEKATLVDEDGGWGLFHIGGRCAELLAYALSRDDKRLELQAVGIGEYEGDVFMIRPVSKSTQKLCWRKRKRAEETARGEGDTGGQDTGRAPPPTHSAFQTVNSGHWQASRYGPWAFDGAGQV